MEFNLSNWFEQLHRVDKLIDDLVHLGIINGSLQNVDWYRFNIDGWTEQQLAEIEGMINIHRGKMQLLDAQNNKDVILSAINSKFKHTENQFNELAKQVQEHFDNMALQQSTLDNSMTGPATPAPTTTTIPTSTITQTTITTDPKKLIEEFEQIGIFKLLNVSRQQQGEFCNQWTEVECAMAGIYSRAYFNARGGNFKDTALTNLKTHITKFNNRIWDQRKMALIKEHNNFEINQIVQTLANCRVVGASSQEYIEQYNKCLKWSSAALRAIQELHLEYSQKVYNLTISDEELNKLLERMKIFTSIANKMEDKLVIFEIDGRIYPSPTGLESKPLSDFTINNKEPQEAKKEAAEAEKQEYFYGVDYGSLSKKERRPTKAEDKKAAQQWIDKAHQQQFNQRWVDKTDRLFKLIMRLMKNGLFTSVSEKSSFAYYDHFPDHILTRLEEYCSLFEQKKIDYFGLYNEFYAQERQYAKPTAIINTPLSSFTDSGISFRSTKDLVLQETVAKQLQEVNKNLKQDIRVSEIKEHSDGRVEMKVSLPVLDQKDLENFQKWWNQEYRKTFGTASLPVKILDIIEETLFLGIISSEQGSDIKSDITATWPDADIDCVHSMIGRKEFEQEFSSTARKNATPLYSSFLTAEEKQIRRDAVILNNQILSGKIKVGELDKLIANGLDQKVVQYWRENYQKLKDKPTEVYQATFKPEELKLPKERTEQITEQHLADEMPVSLGEQIDWILDEAAWKMIASTPDTFDHFREVMLKKWVAADINAVYQSIGSPDFEHRFEMTAVEYDPSFYSKVKFSAAKAKQSSPSQTTRELTQAGYRVLAHQATKMTQDLMLKFIPVDKIPMFKEFLASDLGKSFISMVAGMSLTYGMPEHELAQKLAQEFRISSMATLGNSAADLFTSTLLDVLKELPNQEETKLLEQSTEEEILDIEPEESSINELKDENELENQTSSV